MENMWKIIGLACLVATGQAISILATTALDNEQLKLKKVKR